MKILALLVVWSGLLGLVVAPHPEDVGAVVRYNGFDDDNYADLAIGVPGEGIDTVVLAGAANVLYGSMTGPRPTGSQFWHQNQPGVSSAVEAGDFFGYALTVGDMNCDGYMDLAIGVSGESVDDVDVAGAVNVLYGSQDGLVGTDDPVWNQDFPEEIEDQAEAYDRFGKALAAGDFDGDGCTDLAIGVPEEDLGQLLDAGAVNVLKGSTNGLSSADDEFWHQNQPGFGSGANQSDLFGAALATGDFNGDGYADLAIGVPGESYPELSFAGEVDVLYGSDGGLVASGQSWNRDDPGVGGTLGEGDQFGFALASGDFDRDGYADLAVGLPHDTVGGQESAGTVNILYGSTEGLTGRGEQPWRQGNNGISDIHEELDYFGAPLATGDLNGDGYADLAVGASGESLGTVVATGAVHILYGSAGGITGAGTQFWHQDKPGVEDEEEENDYYGSSLAIGDLNADGYDDLAVGIPWEDMGDVVKAGAVNVLFGSANGVTDQGNLFLHQDVSGLEDGAELDDNLGYSVAIAQQPPKLLGRPKGISASDGTYIDTVRVTWDAAKGAVSYQVHRSESEEGDRSLVGDSSQLGLDDDTAVPDQTYYYWVRGCDGDQCSAFSDPDTGYRPALPNPRVYLPIVLRQWP